MHQRRSALAKRIDGITNHNYQLHWRVERLESRDLLANCADITDVIAYTEFDEVEVGSIDCLSTTQIASIPNRWWFGRIAATAREALNQQQIQSLQVNAVGIDTLTDDQLRQLTQQQIHSLDYQHFRFLLPAQIPSLTESQLASIPTAWWFTRMSEERRAELTESQIPFLNIGLVGIQNLTEEQITFLSVAQIQSLSAKELQYLDAQQIRSVSPEQIASIPNGWIFGKIAEDARALLTPAQLRSLNVAQVGIKQLTPQQISELSAKQLLAVQFQEFRYLSAGEVAFLSTEQISTIPSRWWFTRMSAEARAALNSDQVRALLVSEVGLDGLTPTQLTDLTTGQIKSLGYKDFRFLTATQVPLLTADQVATIPDGWWFTRFSTEARAALTREQVQALDISKIDIRWLTEEQIAYLSADPITSLTYEEFPHLNARQIQQLTPSQIGTIPSAGWFRRIDSTVRATLTADQIRSLNVAEIGLEELTRSQIEFLTPGQITSLSYQEFEYLKANQITSLTSSQLGSLPDRWWFARIPSDVRAALIDQQIRRLDVSRIGISGLTEAQIAVLTTAQVEAVGFRDFQFLQPSQIPSLSQQQLQTIPDRWWFGKITDEARAALTPEQVRWLNIADLGIDRLTVEQVGQLTETQVQSLHFKAFHSLTAHQVPWLTAEQLASIPNDWSFSRWSDEARAALTPRQIRALQVPVVSLSDLTSPQVAELSDEQIQNIEVKDYRYLHANQISRLTSEQIAAIPDSWWFTRIADETRAELTNAQIRQLPTNVVSVKHLTPRQKAALTAAQIQAIPSDELRYILADQAEYVTLAQLSGIKSTWYYKRIPVEVRARFQRAQLFAVDENIMAESVGLPSSFAVTELDHSGANHGAQEHHPDDRAKQNEHMAALNLVPHQAADFVSAETGDWSDPATWVSNSVPTANAKVLIQHGHAVTFDATITPEAAIDTLRVDGALEFVHDLDTQLAVDTIVVDPLGKLHIGTETQPIDESVTARIVFVGNADIDLNWDPNQLSRGLIAHGEVQMYGEDVTPYVALKEDPRHGATQLVLEAAPENWQIGDRLVLTGTHYHYDQNQDEELEIVDIRGNLVSIDADSDTPGQQPLVYDHFTPDGDDGPNASDPGNISPDGDTLKVYVANVNRNVVLLSETPEIQERRGHVMFMHNQDVEIENVGFYGLGRTDKRNPINDPVFDTHGELVAGTGLNPAGRYSVHFHRAGTSYDDQPGWVRGSAIVDSPGWGLVNHQSFVHASDNVAFHVVGASFVTESGNEIGSFVGNLSINNSGSGHGLESRRDTFDFGHGGHGFWAQGPLVEFNENIAAGSRAGAFVFFTQSNQVRIEADLLSNPSHAGGRSSVPVGSVPLKSVRDNTAFASQRGLETWFHQTHMNDGQSLIDGFTSWNTRGESITTPYTGRTTIRNATLIGDTDRPRNIAIGRNNVTNQMTYENVTAIGHLIGIHVPVNRDTTIQDGYFASVRAIQIDRAHDSLREVDILGDPEFVTLSPLQLADREQFDIFMNGGFEMQNLDLETLFTPDVTRLGTIRYNDHQVFYHEQAANYVPFQAENLPGFVPAELIGLTNAELLERYGLAIAGGIAHPEAQSSERINGLIGKQVDYPATLPLLSRKYSNQLKDYQFAYLNRDGNRVTETIDLDAGWNLLTRDVDGATRTFFVFGDVEAPMFVLHGTPTVNPNGLQFGITIRGTIFDNSTNPDSFRKKFDDLDTLSVVAIDGREYLELEFEVRDKSGNTTSVVVHILLDPEAPVVPGTAQESLPARNIPLTLQELLQYFIIRAQS